MEGRRSLSAEGRVQALLVGLLVAAGAATFSAAALACLAGALEPWVDVVALVTGLAVGGLAFRHLRRAPADGPGRAGWLDGLSLLAFGVVAVRQFGWLVFERRGGLVTLLANNYGDLPLHWTYVAHFARGSAFWPENPILTGERLRYPLGVDLLSAVFVQLGAPMRLVLPAMGLCGAVAAGLALWRWGGALAVSGFVFSGGLAGFPFLWSGQLVDYQAAVAWKNLFLALFVPQRGFLLALPAGLLLLWSGRRRLLERREGLASWVEGVLWGGLALVHLHTFAFVSVLLAIWALGGGQIRRALPSLAWAVGPATWAVYEVTDGLRVRSFVGWSPGWSLGDENPLTFLLVNFGLFLPLALWALLLAWRERDRSHLLVLGPALAVLAALFFVRLAPWEWDNTKVMLWCYVATLPSIGTLVLARLPVGWRVLAVAGLLFSGAVSVAAACRGGGPEARILDLAEYEGVCAAVRGLPLQARVATVATFDHPVALCGQPIVAGYPGHLWSHGLEATAVLRSLDRLLRGEPGWRDEARALGARYLFWGHREERAFSSSRRPWEAGAEPVAAGPWGALYRLD